MASVSAYEQAKRLEASIRALFAGLDPSALAPEVRKLVADTKRTSTDIRLDVRDYEFADSRVQQQREASTAKKRLLVLRDDIADPKLHDNIGVVDVAELSGRIDTLIAALE